LVEFLQRCQKSVFSNGGYIGIKENISAVGTLFDEEDSSCTRSDYEFKLIFEKAGLELIREELQTGFPKDLFQVKMYMLR
jgi:protein N-terminal methyltransferase